MIQIAARYRSNPVESINYVSFAVYGANPKYLVGATRNLQLVKRLMPDWTAVFYISPEAHELIGASLVDEQSLVIIKNEPSNHSSMTWRFEAIALPNAEYVIFRDTDSRITSREVRAVQEWVSSGKLLHIMRDHPLHVSKILGGMWGIYAPKAQFVSELLESTAKIDSYGMDQQFLANHVYKRFRNSRLVHDSFFCREVCSRPFSTPRSEGEFVGEVIDEYEMFDVGLREAATKAESNVIRRIQVALMDMRVRTFVALEYFLRTPLKGRGRD